MHQTWFPCLLSILISLIKILHLVHSKLSWILWLISCDDVKRKPYRSLPVMANVAVTHDHLNATLIIHVTQQKYSLHNHYVLLYGKDAAAISRVACFPQADIPSSSCLLLFHSPTPGTLFNGLLNRMSNSRKSCNPERLGKWWRTHRKSSEVIYGTSWGQVEQHLSSEK